MHRNVLNRLYLSLSVILSLLISGIASAQSQQEMNVEAAKELEQADKKLNQVYKELIEQGDPDEDKALRAAQRAWLAYVELHLNYVFPLKKGENPRQKFGSSYSRVQDKKIKQRSKAFFYLAFTMSIVIDIV